MKYYHLTIAYNEETEEIEYIEESISDDKEYAYVDGIELNDYFDQETLKMLSGYTIIGES